MADLSQEEIDALKAAIATGVKKIGYSDRVVEYHPLKEMLDALTVVEAEVAVDNTNGRCTVAGFSRG